MPKVPVISQLAQQDVPTGVSTSLRSEGAVPSALSGFGKTMADVSLGLIQSVRRSESDAFNAKSRDDYEAAQANQKRQLQNDNPSGYILDDSGSPQIVNGKPVTISDKFRDWSTDYISGLKEKSPNSMSTDFLEQHLAGRATTDYIGLQNHEQALHIDHLIVQDQNNAKKRATAIGSGPVSESYSSALSAADDFMAGQKDRIALAGEKHANLIQESSLDSYAKTAIQMNITAAATSKKAGDPLASRAAALDQVQAVLQGQDPESKRRESAGLRTIAGMLTPAQQQEFMKQLVPLRAQAAELDVSDFNTHLVNTKAMLSSGQNVDVAPILSTMRKLESTGKKTKYENANEVAGLREAQLVGYMNTDSFRQLSPSQRDAMAASLSSEVQKAGQQYLGGGKGAQEVGAKFAQTGEGSAKKLVSSLESAETSDFANYYSSVDPVAKRVWSGVDGNAPSTFSSSAASGMGDMIQSQKKFYDTHWDTQEHWQPVPNDIAQSVSGFIKKSNNSEAVATAIRSMRSSMTASDGTSYYSDFVNQMVNMKNGLPEKWRIAAYFGNQSNTESVVEALMSNEKEFHKQLKASSIDINSVSGSVRTQFAPFIQMMKDRAPNDPSNGKAVESFNGVFTYVAGKQLLDKTSYNAGDAAGVAYKNLVSSNGMIGEVGHGYKSFVSIPSEIDRSVVTRDVADRMQFTANQIMGNPMGVDLGPGNSGLPSLKSIGIQPPPRASGVPTKFGDEFYQQLSDKGRLQAAPGDRGMYIWYPAGGRWTQAQGADGKPFVLEWSKLKEISTATSGSGKADYYAKRWNQYTRSLGVAGKQAALNAASFAEGVFPSAAAAQAGYNAIKSYSYGSAGEKASEVAKQIVKNSKK